MRKPKTNQKPQTKCICCWEPNITSPNDSCPVHGKPKPPRTCATCDWHMWDYCDIDGYCGNPDVEIRCTPNDRKGWKHKPQPSSPPAGIALTKEETDLAIEALKHRVLLYRTQHEGFVKSKHRPGQKPEDVVAWIDRFEQRVNAVIAKLKAQP